MDESVVFFLIVAIGCLSGLVATAMTHRRKQQAERAQLLEKALQNPNLDRPTLESLAYQLAGRRPLRSPDAESYGRTMAWVLALGWLMLFLGVGLLIGGEVGRDGDLAVGGWIVGLIGLGLVSFPFALRELEARRAAP